ncbi:PAS domain S-box protein [Roseomonas nepalensis]|uniref:histidine kinase n=1 Tax=Muricoccus nepalensis TaxID=1854500 RepID=A0A502GIL8_9PROT|nr:PAS domain S-box protein [Roseomonas nepalensis]TPG61140.1 PAS domain S-box protein [Roseomonas nepalensis]
MPLSAGGGEGWPAGGGMAARIRAYDWPATALGPIGDWPPGLRAAVDLMLAVREPVFLLWGPRACLLHNDGFLSLLGEAGSPGGCEAALGRDVELPPPVREALRAGEPHRLAWEGLGLPGTASTPRRRSAFSLTPVWGEDGAVAGFCGVAASPSRPGRSPDAAGGVGRVGEDQLADIFTHASVGLSVVGTNGRFITVNDELCRILGRPREVLMQSGVADVTFADDLLPSLDAVVRTLRTGEPSSLDKRYIRPDGSHVWASSTITRLRDAGGEAAKLLVVTIDLTARRDAEELLRQSEERLRFVIENVRDYAILITDPQGVVTSWFPGAEAAFGWRPEEIVGQPASVLFTPEDRAAGLPGQEFALARETGDAPSARWHLRRDGGRVFLDGRSVALRRADGALRGFLKIGQDVTGRRAAEEKLARSEALFRTLATGIDQLVFLGEPTGARDWSSPQWCDFTGLGAKASRGYGWLDAVHPDDREATRGAWSEAAVESGLYVEHRLRRADGAYRWHQTRARPVRRGEGAASEWVGASTDVHQLRHLQEVQSVLVAELQHRTRNLIGVVRSLADSTLARSASMEDFRGRFSDRLGALARVQGLLARQETGQRVTFGELIRTSLSGPGAFDDGGQVTLEGPASVGLRSGKVQTLALALHELATNALKYGALSVPGGHLSVRWCVEQDGEGQPRLQIEWQESGVGLPAPPEGAEAKRGYGRELIERALPYQLQAETAYAIRPDGVCCRISLPIPAR